MYLPSSFKGVVVNNVVDSVVFIVVSSTVVGADELSNDILSVTNRI